MTIADCTKIEPTTTPITPKNAQIIKDAAAKLGIETFKEGQELVMSRAMWEYNVAYIAPTGLGKSLCFAVPAIVRAERDGPGVTLVIEPLKCIIDSQLTGFNKHCDVLEVYALRSHKDSKSEKVKSGELIISELAQKARGKIPISKNNNPVILFASPELVLQPVFLYALETLYKAKKLHHIVVDEFDYIADSTENYRKAYKQLPKVRTLCPQVPFMFLSATTKQEEFLEIVNTFFDFKSPEDIASGLKLRLVQTERLISDSLSFSVVRKINDVQVATSIAHTLKCYENQNGDKPIALVYCISINTCDQMSFELNVLGIKASAYTSNNAVERSALIKKVKSGKLQVICATKALGRGVDIHNVRFVFHSSLPGSLSDYIQESGRAGRDNKQSFCVLFYKPQDRARVDQIVKFGGLSSDENKRHNKNLKEVLSYCTCGNVDRCRYDILCKAAVSLTKDCQANINSFMCKSKCDNCQVLSGETSNFYRKGSNLDGKVNDSDLLELQSKELVFIKIVLEELVNEFKSISTMTGSHFKQLVRNIPEFDETLKEKGRFATTLSSDLLRLFVHFNIVILSRSSSRISLKTENCLDLLKQIDRGEAKFFLRKWVLPEETSSDTSIYPCTVSTLTNSVTSTSFSS